MSGDQGSNPGGGLLRIGELAARSGRSVHAIRWYESQGLMPNVARDAAGRRVYHARHLGWLQLMDRLRCTGMSIAEMREYTALVLQGRTSLRQRKDLLLAHRAKAQATIAESCVVPPIMRIRSAGLGGNWPVSGLRT